MDFTKGLGEGEVSYKSLKNWVRRVVKGSKLIVAVVTCLLDIF